MSGCTNLSTYKQAPLDAFTRPVFRPKLAAQQCRVVSQLYQLLAEEHGSPQIKKKTVVGRPTKLSMREESRPVRLAPNSTQSADDLRRHLDLQVSKWTIRGSLIRNPHIVHQLWKRVTCLTARHRAASVGFARAHTSRGWKKVSYPCSWLGLQKKNIFDF